LKVLARLQRDPTLELEVHAEGDPPDGKSVIERILPSSRTMSVMMFERISTAC
jgi:hypothetical protein